MISILMLLGLATAEPPAPRSARRSPTSCSPNLPLARHGRSPITPRRQSHSARVHIDELPGVQCVSATFSGDGQNARGRQGDVGRHRQSPADDADTVAAYVKSTELPFRFLKDEGHAWADKLGVERVADVMVLDAGRTVR